VVPKYIFFRFGTLYQEKSGNPGVRMNESKPWSQFDESVSAVIYGQKSIGAKYNVYK
jgi:hypothetical protein